MAQLTDDQTPEDGAGATITPRPGAEVTVRLKVCALPGCGKLFVVGTEQLRFYCDEVCRQAARRRRKAERSP